MAQQPARTAQTAYAVGFKESYGALVATRPAIKEKFRTFLEFKTSIPPRVLPAGFKDHELGDRLKGYRECHLAGDILVVYTLKNNLLSLLMICTHDELRGGREKDLARRLSGIHLK